LAKSRYSCFLIVILILGIVIIADSSQAQTYHGHRFLDRNLAGGRIGVWTNTGDEKASPDFQYSMDFSKSSICADFFYDLRLGRALCLDFQLGLYSRGDVEYKRDSGKYVGSVNIYPFFVATKFYPLYTFESMPIHLYLQPGVGFVIGSQNIVDYDLYYTYDLIQQETRVGLSYMLSAGLEWPVADQIALLLNYKYVPVKFGSPLAQLKDYSGWSVTFGIGYIFSS
jgi:opacity protein-like surface antigen